MDKIVAQIAVEAVINNPAAFNLDDVKVVAVAGQNAGVAGLYMDPLVEIIQNWDNLVFVY